MADQPDTTSTPEIHELTGSTPPSGQAPAFKPVTRPKPHPRPRLQRHPMGLRDVSDEAEVIDLAERLVRLLKRTSAMFARLDVLKLHHLCLDQQVLLEKLIDRAWRRISRTMPQLAATRAPTARAAAAKGNVLIEIAVIDDRKSDPFDVLALSVAHDVIHLGLEAECLPQGDGDMATLSQMADIEFEPWDMEDFSLPTNAEWGGVFAETHLATSRIAWGMCRKTKFELVEMVRSLEESSGEDVLSHLSEDLHATAAFFGAFQDLARAAEIRLLSAGAMLARQQGEPTAQPGYRETGDAVDSNPRLPDRRAVEAYRQWLDLEGAYLAGEMYPQGGEDAYRFIPWNTAAHHFHDDATTPGHRPSDRAEAMCQFLGIDWRSEPVGNEEGRPDVACAARVA